MSEPFEQGFDSASTDPGGAESFQSSSPAEPGNDSGPTDQGTSDNPAWTPALSGIPDVLHTPLKTHFKKWDENYRGLETKYQELEGKYKVYEPYQDVDPRFLANGLSLLNMTNKEPMRVYTLLQEHLRQQGLLPGDAPERLVPNSSSEDQQQYEEDDPRYSELDERTRQLDERQQRIDQYVQQQENQKMVSRYEAQIDQQVQAVVQKYGANIVDIEDLMERMMAQVSTGKNYDAEKAYQSQVAFFRRMNEKQASTGKPAPQILSPTGTPAPSGEMDPRKMNEDQRKAYFKQLLDVANAGG